MQKQNIIRTFVFVIFAGIGAAALSSSILCNDLVGYYHNKILLKKAQESQQQLKSLITNYQALLSNLQKDPNLIKRTAPATLGAEPADTNAIYPNTTGELLAAAREALSENQSPKSAPPNLPTWLTRCCQPARRIILLIAGAFLILISFACFGPTSR